MEPEAERTDDAAGNRLDMVLRGGPSDLERLAAAVDAFVDRNALSPDLAFRFNLCFDELITNTVSYGYGDARAHRIRVRLETDGHELRAEIEDDAAPFDPFTDAPAPDLESGLEDRRIGGLGVFLVRRMMDRADYRLENGRNLTRFAKRIG